MRPKPTFEASGGYPCAGAHRSGLSHDQLRAVGESALAAGGAEGVEIVLHAGHGDQSVSRRLDLLVDPYDSPGSRRSPTAGEPADPRWTANGDKRGGGHDWEDYIDDDACAASRSSGSSISTSVSPTNTDQSSALIRAMVVAATLSVLHAMSSKIERSVLDRPSRT